MPSERSEAALLFRVTQQRVGRINEVLVTAISLALQDSRGQASESTESYTDG
jgi:hypothetical protein